MIKIIAFDMGGVVFEIDKQRAIKHFAEIGVAQAAELLDDFQQTGIFGDLESGAITDEEFRVALSDIAGTELSWEQCRHGWLGYFKQLHQYSLDGLTDLRRRGYRLCLLTNTNPFMMSWTRSAAFDGHGHGIQHYFDAIYASYEMGVMKPDKAIFEMMLTREAVRADEVLFIDDSIHNTSAANEIGIHTLQPANGSDWRPLIDNFLHSFQ